MELNHFIFVDESCPCCEGKKCANHAALSLEQRKQNQSASTILALYTRKRFRKAKATHEFLLDIKPSRMRSAAWGFFSGQIFLSMNIQLQRRAPRKKTRDCYQELGTFSSSQQKRQDIFASGKSLPRPHFSIFFYLRNT